MVKEFKRYAALSLVILLVVCALAAQAENVVSKPGDMAGQDDGVFRYRENGAEEKVDVTLIEEEQMPERFSYHVTSHDAKIKYCVPSARMGSISVGESNAAEMKLVLIGGKQECRIYFDREFEFVYEPSIGIGTKAFGDEIQLDFYLENGQWICKKTVSLSFGFDIPHDNRNIEGGWRELGSAFSLRN